VIRLAYWCTYAILAIVGHALVARPALLWLRSQGIFGPALAWDVPCGALLVAAAAALAICTVWLASHAAMAEKPVLPLHVVFLLLVGACFVLRATSGEPQPPNDPAPVLVSALQIAAEELDRGFDAAYVPDASRLAAALSRIAPPRFRRLGRRIAFQARILSGMRGAQLEALPGDRPATIYVAISEDRRSAWLTALSLDGILELPQNGPAIAEAHAGTHSAPGADPGMPAYPR
jgi:hypothetical protein